MSNERYIEERKEKQAEPKAKKEQTYYKNEGTIKTIIQQTKERQNMTVTNKQPGFFRFANVGLVFSYVCVVHGLFVCIFLFFFRFVFDGFMSFIFRGSEILNTQGLRSMAQRSDLARIGLSAGFSCERSRATMVVVSSSRAKSCGCLEVFEVKT